MILSDYEELDLKLKDLVQLSKKNNDSKRAAVVFYLLIRREINKKGIYLGFAPLISKKERKAFEYMNAINAIMEANFHFYLFNKNVVANVQKYELLYLRSPGSFSFDSLKELINIYYELRQLEVPNMYHSLDEMNFNSISLAMNKSKLFSLSSNKKVGSFFRRKEPNQVTQYLSLDVEQKERMTEEKLKIGYDKKSFEELLQLRKLKKEIKEGNSPKISFKGKLKENPYYQQEIDQVPGFILIGLAVLFIMLAVLLFLQDYLLPEIAGSFTLLSFALFGGAILIILFYWKLFYQEI